MRQQNISQQGSTFRTIAKSGLVQLMSTRPQTGAQFERNKFGWIKKLDVIQTILDLKMGPLFQRHIHINKLLSPADLIPFFCN